MENAEEQRPCGRGGNILERVVVSRPNAGPYVVRAGANLHQISRFENATGQWLGDHPNDGRVRLNRRLTGGSPTSYE